LSSSRRLGSGLGAAEVGRGDVVVECGFLRIALECELRRSSLEIPSTGQRLEPRRRGLAIPFPAMLGRSRGQARRERCGQGGCWRRERGEATGELRGEVADDVAKEIVGGR